MYNDDETNTIIVEENVDQCYTCCWFNNPDRACPLLEALMTPIVYLDEELDVAVQNCGFYEKFQRKLKAVPNVKSDFPETTTEPDRSENLPINLLRPGDANLHSDGAQHERGSSSDG